MKTRKKTENRLAGKVKRAIRFRPGECHREPPAPYVSWLRIHSTQLALLRTRLVSYRLASILLPELSAATSGFRAGSTCRLGGYFVRVYG